MGKQCFSCKRCGRSMDSLAVSVGPDQDIYCNVCLKIVSAPERPQVITDTTIIMGSGDPENKDSCPRCGGKVFEAEKMTGKYGAYHRQCFKCMKCKRPLDYPTLISTARTATRTRTVTSRRQTFTTRIAANCRARRERQMSAQDALGRCLRRRSRSRSPGATTGSVSPAPSTNIRWIQQTSQTDLTMRSTASTATS